MHTRVIYSRINNIISVLCDANNFRMICPQMGPQLSQLGNLGIGINPQFTQQ
ncbi:hypothetical protein HYC85_003950 [Camellia sinensis]|uniref:Uncharacterized protein n=1 Tax=Camellia sinensis TaxID=4442 RepID=A0A7J7HW35_CAMSI|nr:hypothetical protein HYC85_003950 [Camellia sinensis]